MSQDHTKCIYISCTAFQSHHVPWSPQHGGGDWSQKQSNNVEDSSRPQQVVKMHNFLAAPHLCVLVVPSSQFHHDWDGEDRNVLPQEAHKKKYDT